MPFASVISTPDWILPSTSIPRSSRHTNHHLLLCLALIAEEGRGLPDVGPAPCSSTAACGCHLCRCREGEHRTQATPPPPSLGRRTLRPSRPSPPPPCGGPRRRYRRPARSKARWTPPSGLPCCWGVAPAEDGDNGDGWASSSARTATPWLPSLRLTTPSRQRRMAMTKTTRPCGARPRKRM
uniref:Uncharacterized protein n=1 Tax=Zea mays TaxID=4577 RepID=A0A804RQ95_MAIZE